MQIIVRDGIRIALPPDVAAAGGEAVEAYVAGMPADFFPPVPAALRQPTVPGLEGKPVPSGPAYDAYLAELATAGVLAPLQARADARYAADMVAYRERSAPKPEEATEDPSLDAARKQAQALVASLQTPAGVPDPAPASRPDRKVARGETPPASVVES